ncbi:MAG: tetrahydromethanopterin S-methyltransferase subunit F [Methanocorpusculum sp.]|uniref:Tetrahydromethanopterin S-methyltransferase subunit F n=1 Tax=Methanocorpusculum petauri TaxID=3002863 RepID=A0ABT4IH54_9EURY|nr:tetrahydromethanopterin S-methyltransferase subunit F [Methanocorpusculum petauri]MDE2443409.1 tetrahydromethanopterin S-methyltransferase subunit F [Methanocorpusculum sp.]MCZ0860689.1 tetrahydromethanopterin S-methyltransferase subunit F [Methanocorpusculum petauri]MDE2518497.1 tetrahydromethanopterin S-methyltransferase subunit F [Methanocorpusculum sp.]MDE2522259.1 tetrahydromethanopterin S-methyltransferase subunit F [Methanocorpusculum sp.]MDE2524730.1 tetrahydromethanopterin S-methyl
MAGSIIRMAAIDKMVDDIRYKGQILARTHKVESAITDSGLVGFGAGLVIALIMILVPVLVL